MKTALVFVTKKSLIDKDNDYYCSSSLKRVLEKVGLTTKFCSPTEFKSMFEKDKSVSLVAFPGSELDVVELFKKLSKSDIQSIQNFVSLGGRYLGVCMGGFLAYYLGFLVGYTVNPLNERRHMGRAQLTPVSFNGTTRNIYVESPPDFSGLKQDNLLILSKHKDNSIDMFITPVKEGKIILSSSHFEADTSWSDKFKIPDNTDIGVFCIQKLME
jgi:glutamine amidotransferase-like uncharacterized protein